VNPPRRATHGAEPTAAQARVIAAALELFAEHGVGGTSLRMIAGELGVTVAAVYHQYNTKNEIIVAAVESELLRLKTVVDTAEAEPTSARAREALIAGIVELTIGIGRSMSAVLNDPIITGSFGRDTAYRNLMRRIRLVLMGNDTTRRAPIRTATFMAAINGAATHPFLADLDDETLRRELLYVAHQLLPAAEHIA
jgi:AcrR family transcriptional regulator